MNKKMLSGSFWLSFGSILSRILGVIYLIPWLIMLGSYGNQLNAQAIFNSSYTPYALFIAVGTAGLPSVIARKVAYLNSDHRYLDSVSITKIGISTMVIMGIICGVALYLLAPIIAVNSPVRSLHDATLSIRMLVPAIVILPSMSMIRGWYQGNNDMKPYGVSQLWEQFSRVLFIILATFLIVKVLHKSYIMAVYFSVFGAFIGALASYFYLFAYGRKKQPTYAKMLQQSKRKTLTNISSTVFELWYSSIPFVLVGSCITMSQFIDQVFFKQILIKFDAVGANYANYLYTVFSANPSKITTVIISLVTAVSETSLPLFSQLRYENNPTKIKNLLLENYKLLLFFLFPIIIISSFLAPEMYTILFSHDPLGSNFLVQNIIQSVFLGLAINALTILQALNKNAYSIMYMTVGILLKLTLQFPFVWIGGASGAIVATDVAFAMILILGYRHLDHEYHVNLRDIVPIIYLGVMLLVILGAYHAAFPHLLETTSRMISFIYAAIYGLITVSIYLIMANKMCLARENISIFQSALGFPMSKLFHPQTQKRNKH